MLLRVLADELRRVLHRGRRQGLAGEKLLYAARELVEAGRYPIEAAREAVHVLVALLAEAGIKGFAHFVKEAPGRLRSLRGVDVVIYLHLFRGQRAERLILVAGRVVAVNPVGVAYAVDNVVGRAAAVVGGDTRPALRRAL